MSIKNITIKHCTDEDAMFGNDPEATTGVDIEASKVKFEQMVQAKIQTEYPGVNVEFAEAHKTKVVIDGEDDHEEADYIGWRIFHEVWEDWQWIVEAE